jgi:RNA polymerase primary sigma factor
MDISNIESFLKNVREYNYLSIDEMNELIRLGKSGDNNARDKVINSNLRLVLSIALKYSTTNYEDYIQEGCIGLIMAFDKYQFENGHFISWAQKYIHFKIKDYINRTDPLISIPYNVKKNNNIIDKKIEYGDTNDLFKSELVRYNWNNGLKNKPLSISIEGDEEYQHPILDNLRDDNIKEYDNLPELSKNLLNEMIPHLKPKYQEFIRYYYFEYKSIIEISKILNVQTKTVQRRKYYILNELKRLIQEKNR